jgi:hypothetical protein
MVERLGKLLARNQTDTVIGLGPVLKDWRLSLSTLIH